MTLSRWMRNGSSKAKPFRYRLANTEVRMGFSLPGVGFAHTNTHAFSIVLNLRAVWPWSGGQTRELQIRIRCGCSPDGLATQHQWIDDFMQIWRPIATVAPVSLIALACGNAPDGHDKQSIDIPANGGADGSDSAGDLTVKVPDGQRVGDDCSSAEPCRVGLDCSDGVCAPWGATALGEACVIGAECVESGQCIGGECTQSAGGPLGASCESSLDCGATLRCGLRGMAALCLPEGTGDAGAACEASVDCYAGLACSGGRCQPEPFGLPGLLGASFNAVECDAPSEEGDTVRALFELPDLDGSIASDFFASPWPSDARLVDGRPDLDGFPTPGSALLGTDPLTPYVEALEHSAHGWGTDPAIVFRFSGEIDSDSLRDSGQVAWIDITAGAQSYGENAGLQWSYSSGRSNSVCDNSLAVRRPVGAPLRPGHTYGIWVGTGALAKDGSVIERSPQLELILSDEEPADAELVAAWRAYQPLRDFVADPHAPSFTTQPVADAILLAAVVTVDDVLDPMVELAAAVEAEPIAEAHSWVLCSDAVESPCPQAEGDRACGAPNDDFDEYHALLSLPVFQAGHAPYLVSGGGIQAQAERTEDVCLSLTVPHGEMPEAGWPLVVYAHGTGGTFRSHVRPEVAGVLASADLGERGPGFAVLGVDQVQHGTRRGGSEESPESLFFNYSNPDAARGNPMQGAADQLAIARFARALDVDGETTGGGHLRFNASAVFFFGHSQGATEGSLALPFGAYSAAILSGNGASIRDALLTKTKPINIAEAVPFALGDPIVRAGELAVLDGGAFHPALTLISQWVGPADPLNFARLTGQEPLEGQGPIQLFNTYGLGDTFSPKETLVAYIRAGGFTEITSSGDSELIDELALPIEDPPYGGNLTVDQSDYSLLVRQYEPAEGSDGHTVVFDVVEANADAIDFLVDAALGELPVIGE